MEYSIWHMWLWNALLNYRHQPSTVLHFESVTTQVQSFENFDSLEDLQLNIQLLLTQLASLQNITVCKATFPPHVLSHLNTRSITKIQTVKRHSLAVNVGCLDNRCHCILKLPTAWSYYALSKARWSCISHEFQLNKLSKGDFVSNSDWLANVWPNGTDKNVGCQVYDLI